MTVLRIKREKEKLIIRFKYSQAAERNDFTFTRIMVFILFFFMFSMFLEAIHESLDCSDNDEEALFAICLLCAAIGNKGR